jgi:hypothetical protein
VKPLSLKDGEPLLHLIHPGAVDWGEVELKPGMILEPFSHLFSMMDTHVVTDAVDEGNGRGSLPINMFKERDEFFLPFAAKALTDDVSGSGVEGGKEIEGSVSSVLMLHQIGLVSRLCRFCGTNPWSGLQRGFLIHRENDLMKSKRTGVEIDDRSNALIESLIPGVFGREPHVAAPGL